MIKQDCTTCEFSFKRNGRWMCNYLGRREDVIEEGISPERGCDVWEPSSEAMDLMED